jgi:hypothetical protein
MNRLRQHHLAVGIYYIGKIEIFINVCPPIGVNVTITNFRRKIFGVFLKNQRYDPKLFKKRALF